MADYKVPEHPTRATFQEVACYWTQTGREQLQFSYRPQNIFG